MSNPNSDEQVRKPVKEQWLTDENQGLLSNMNRGQISKFIRYVGYSRHLNVREYKGTSYQLVCYPINTVIRCTDNATNGLSYLSHETWYWVCQTAINGRTSVLTEFYKLALEENRKTLVSMYVKVLLPFHNSNSDIIIAGAIKEDMPSVLCIGKPLTGTLFHVRRAAHWLLLRELDSRVGLWPRLASSDAFAYDQLTRNDIAKTVTDILDNIPFNHLQSGNERSKGVIS